MTSSTSLSRPTTPLPQAVPQGDPTSAPAGSFQCPVQALPREVEVFLDSLAQAQRPPSSPKEGRLYGSQVSLHTEGSSSGDGLDGIHVTVANGDLGATALRVQESAWEKRPFWQEKQ